jgi:hypothetical protein
MLTPVKKPVFIQKCLLDKLNRNNKIAYLLCQSYESGLYIYQFNNFLLFTSLAPHKDIFYEWNVFQAIEQRITGVGSAMKDPLLSISNKARGW